MSSETALAPAPETAVAAFDPNDRRGKENIGKADIIFPRLALAQRTSPQIDPDKDERIEGLQLYQMFNTLTQENYGNGPIEFTVVSFRKFAIEFDEDGKVIDRNVPITECRLPSGRIGYTDERLNFGEDTRGRMIKPTATLFYEFLIIVDDTLETLLLTMKGTQVKTAKMLVSMMQGKPGAVWLYRYRLTSGSTERGGKTVAAFKVVPNGRPSIETSAFAAALYENVQGKDLSNLDDLAVEVKKDEDAIPF
jgi:hypothetical protein